MPKTRKELAAELGISTVTLWRALKHSNLQIPPGYINQDVEQKILRYLGVIPPENPLSEEEE